MEERREISRVEYKTNGVVVICDTQEKIYVDVKDISPLGMGICVPEGHEGLLGKQVISVSATTITCFPRRPSRKTGDRCGRNTDHLFSEKAFMPLRHTDSHA